MLSLRCCTLGKRKKQNSMKSDKTKKISKFMSLVLRHKPETIGLQLDAAGWVSVSALLEGMRAKGKSLTREQLDEVVADNDKQRFEISDDGTLIRARQGHSVEVALGYEEVEPPELLHHGTPTQFVASIREHGLNKQKRHHVHLHQDPNLASTVGSRRGTPVVLTIESQNMAAAGHKFYVTENEVWLTDHVPPKFIRFPTES